MPITPAKRVGGARERAKASVLEDLMQIATRHLAENGASELSLRAIARELGMVSSAVYRYVSSREDLVTLLIMRAYNVVGDIAQDALESSTQRGASPADCWLTVAREIRSWAMTSPHEFALIYGSPIRGYRAPQETVVAAVRLWRVIAAIMEAAAKDGTLRVPERPFETGGLIADAVLEIAEAPSAPYADSIVRSLTLFTSLIGGISAELYGHLVGFSSDNDRMFDLMIATAAAGVGLDISV